MTQPETQHLPHLHRPPTPGVTATAFNGGEGSPPAGTPPGPLEFRLPECPTRQEGGPAPTDTPFTVKE